MMAVYKLVFVAHEKGHISVGKCSIRTQQLAYSMKNIAVTHIPIALLVPIHIMTPSTT